ncbi:hypothetical protein IGI04_035375 [Brassica rapa subsp. trilocularis]|uniref:Mitochondrial pyruvate carrier n=1 Tax=Brassica rapa subsp. trilocularis TaxID=1813537 RepID=A0ABQ7LE67_BRACM|nr:hypothetical protein IGI04_035375 [Brassica rapa subsp. trilocularis]
MATSKLKTIHFWAPTFKWDLSIANIADFQKPPENILYLHTVITPKNWNLFSVNVAMAATGVYQLSRKIK